jgi:hypothetical protein
MSNLNSLFGLITKGAETAGENAGEDQNYIPNQSIRSPGEWGTPDEILNGMKSNASPSTGPFTPQQQQVPQILNSIIQGIGGRNGSGAPGINMSVLGMGLIYNAFMGAYKKGQYEAAIMHHNRVKLALEESDERMKRMLMDYGMAGEEHGPRPAGISRDEAGNLKLTGGFKGRRDINYEARKQAYLDVARKWHDQKMIDMINNQGLGAAEAHLQAMDHYSLEMSKLREQMGKTEEEYEKVRNLKEERSLEHNLPSYDESTPKQSPEEAAKPTPTPTTGEGGPTEPGPAEQPYTKGGPDSISDTDRPDGSSTNQQPTDPSRPDPYSTDINQLKPGSQPRPQQQQQQPQAPAQQAPGPQTSLPPGEGDVNNQSQPGQQPPPATAAGGGIVSPAQAAESKDAPSGLWGKFTVRPADAGPKTADGTDLAKDKAARPVQGKFPELPQAHERPDLGMTSQEIREQALIYNRTNKLPDEAKGGTGYERGLRNARADEIRAYSQVIKNYEERVMKGIPRIQEGENRYDYIKTITPSLRALDNYERGLGGQLEAVLKGDMAAASSGYAANSNTWQRFSGYVSMIDPTALGPLRYNLNYRTRLAFNNGTYLSQSRAAISTAMENAHYALLLRMGIKNGDNYYKNMAQNYFAARWGGDPAQISLATVQNHLAEEVARAFRGSGLAEADIRRELQSGDLLNLSDPQAAGYLQSLAILLNGRMNSLAQIWNTGTGQNLRGVDMMDEDAKKAYSQLVGLNVNGINIEPYTRGLEKTYGVYRRVPGFNAPKPMDGDDPNYNSTAVGGDEVVPKVNMPTWAPETNFYGGQ